ncbi:hypothetical protein [Vibrio neptunius]|nr:hypothetical protein [Vibrio neptunius]MBN3550834.1 hypothetical protein [Vibrio neptunius]
MTKVESSEMTKVEGSEMTEVEGSEMTKRMGHLKYSKQKRQWSKGNEYE